jgi:hypothetical protein
VLYLLAHTESFHGRGAAFRGPRFNILLSTHRHLGLPNGIFPSGFPPALLFEDFIVVVVPIKEECKDIKYKAFLLIAFLSHKCCVFLPVVGFCNGAQSVDCLCVVLNTVTAMQ